MSTRRRAVAVLCATAISTSGCGAAKPAAVLSGAPRDIVINRGGAVEIIDDATSGPVHHVTGTSDGTTPDPMSLRRIRQLTPHQIVAIRDGNLVILNPAEPAQARTIAAATDWFPDHRGTGAWVVTETTDQSCAIADTTAGFVRYQLRHTDLDSSPSAAQQLPCRTRPVADTSAGLLAETLRDEVIEHGNGGSVPADVQLIDRTTFNTISTVRASATVADAAAGTVVISVADCRARPCTIVTSVDPRQHRTVGTLPDNGELTGSVLLDPTGRYLAAASTLRDGTHRLIVSDLTTGTARDLGPYQSTTPQATEEFTEDMPAVWSGSRLLIVDPQAPTLTAYQVANGHTSTRRDLTTSGTLQVWGAAN